MVSFLKRVLLTLIALAVLVVIENAFGWVPAAIMAGVGFLLYLLWITMRQMREEDAE